MDEKKTFDFVKNFNKEVEKMDGVGTTAAPPRYWFGFGNFALNRIMSGSFYKGIPQGRITALCGPSSAGKSYLAANLCKQAQKDGAHILVVDSENALDDTFMTNVGVDTTDKYYYTSPTTIPQATKIISSFIKGYREESGVDEKAPKVLIVIDSLDMLMTDTEKDHYEKGQQNFDQGQQSRQQKSMLKSFVQDIKQLNISIVATKSVYKAKQDQLLAGEGIWVVNDAIRYACSQIVLVTRLKLKDEATKTVNGIRLKAQGFKTRFCAPFLEVSLNVPYDTGIDPYNGSFDVALSAGVITQVGSWYTLKGDEKKYRRADIEATMMDNIIAECEKITNIELKVSDDDTQLPEDKVSVAQHKKDKIAQ